MKPGKFYRVRSSPLPRIKHTEPLTKAAFEVPTATGSKLPYRDDHRDPIGAYERRKVAVALSYELGGETLPKIVATGKGAIAERIVALAFANGVRVREDRELAQLLSTVELDSEIP